MTFHVAVVETEGEFLNVAVKVLWTGVVEDTLVRSGPDEYNSHT